MLFYGKQRCLWVIKQILTFCLMQYFCNHFYVSRHLQYVWLFPCFSVSHTFSLTLLGSEGYWPSSSLSTYTEEHLVHTVMLQNHKQPTGVQVHSTTTTRRGEMSANEQGACSKCVCVCFVWWNTHWAPPLIYFSLMHPELHFIHN